MSSFSIKNFDIIKRAIYSYKIARLINKLYLIGEGNQLKCAVKGGYIRDISNAQIFLVDLYILLIPRDLQKRVTVVRSTRNSSAIFV